MHGTIGGHCAYTSDRRPLASVCTETKVTDRIGRGARGGRLCGLSSRTRCFAHSLHDGALSHSPCRMRAGARDYEGGAGAKTCIYGDGAEGFLPVVGRLRLDHSDWVSFSSMMQPKKIACAGDLQMVCRKLLSASGKRWRREGGGIGCIWGCLWADEEDGILAGWWARAMKGIRRSIWAQRVVVLGGRRALLASRVQWSATRRKPSTVLLRYTLLLCALLMKR
jgi:hypothetical protein